MIYNGLYYLYDLVAKQPLLSYDYRATDKFLAHLFLFSIYSDKFNVKNNCNCINVHVFTLILALQYI